METIKSLVSSLSEEINETSDNNPVVTVSRRNLRALLALIEKEYSEND